MLLVDSPSNRIIVFLLFANSRFLLPAIATLLVTSASFPAGLGQYSAGIVSVHVHVSFA